MTPFQRCRSCYNHVGGFYATQYFQFLQNQKYIKTAGDSHDSPAHTWTDRGRKYITSIPGLSQLSLYPIEVCLDGTEKKYHLKGKGGSILFQWLQKNNLVQKVASDRTLHITPDGITFLTQGTFNNVV